MEPKRERGRWSRHAKGGARVRERLGVPLPYPAPYATAAVSSALGGAGAPVCSA